jgi:aryl-alcohol dehydrogenase-like predicted oxidoreductase
MIQQQKLGSQGLVASRLGLGCMGMSEFYGPHDDTESLAVIDRALELGINFLDTADAYGPYTNEILVGKAIKGRRDRFVVATKFGFVRNPTDSQWRGMSGKPAYVQQACEASLKRLDIDTIDLYYLHRVDPETPIEDTVGAMSRLVEQGKVRALGLSEVSVPTLERAGKVHPISAVQTEYSLWTRDPEIDMLSYCRDHDIAFVAYSPLGRGFLTGKIRSLNDLTPDDWRRNAPRFSPDNFVRNQALANVVVRIAGRKGCTPAQLALSWVMAQGEHIFPIPGTKRLKYLEDNAGAADIRWTPEELAEISSFFPPDAASGTRYTEGGMKIVNA